jgi:hypothetical protein
MQARHPSFLQQLAVDANRTLAFQEPDPRSREYISGQSASPGFRPKRSLSSARAGDFVDGVSK